jgi:class 3 adenylate cyclase/tetratricopeptide (TPR) repeat protein
MQCASCGHAASHDASFCSKCGARLHAVRGHAGELPHGERRRATVLFADLCGYTALNERFDPEEVAEVMNEIKAAATAIVGAHGGLVNQFVGDEVLALFGVPHRHEDDARRAVAAAFELHHHVRELGERLAGRLGERLRLHTGINTGLIITQLRDQRDGLYGITGDAVNTAARIRSAAQPDQVWIGPATRREIDGYFATEATPALALRGKQNPLVPYRVLGVAASSRFAAAQQRGLTEFQGRQAELERLKQSFASARSGAGVLVAISGRPGMGKTRLVHELQLALPAGEVSVCAAQCESYGNPPPLNPFLSVLRFALLGRTDAVEDPAALLRARLPELPESLRAHLPVCLHLLRLCAEEFPLPAEARDEALGGAILDALVAVVHALAEQRTLVLLFEDWHWADAASDQALRGIARSIAAARVLIVVNHRPELARGFAACGAVEIELGPLPDADSEALIRSLLRSRGLPVELAPRIHQRTGGNALFSEEVCRALSESGALDLSTVDLPDTVQGAIHARIDRLAPAAAEMLRCAAVLRADFSAGLLERMLEDEREPGAESLRPQLDQLEAADLLQGQGDAAERSYRFKHALVREVTYETLLLKRRRTLHRAAARAIESSVEAARLPEHYEELAHHYSIGEDPERAVLYLERAGDKAAVSAALRQAGASYARAIEISAAGARTPDEVRRHVDLCLKWAQASVYDPAVEQLDILRRAESKARSAGYAMGAARTVYWRGWIRHALGSHGDAIVEFERSLRDARDLEDLPLVAQLHCNLGQSYFHTADYARAVEQLEDAIEVRARAARDAGRSWVTANALQYLALIDADRGAFDVAYGRVRSAMSIVREGQLQFRGTVLTILGVAQCLQGDWKGCATTAAEMREIGEHVGAPYLSGMGRALDGCARFHEGERAGGIEALAAAAAQLEAAHTRLAISLVYALHAELLAADGQLEPARREAERAVDRASEEDRLGEVAAYRVLGMMAARAPDSSWERAASHFEHARALAEQRGSTRDAALVELRTAECLLERGEDDRAAELAARAAGSFRTMRMAWYARHAEALASRGACGSETRRARG